MRKREPTPIHAHKKAEFILYELSPVCNYTEEELSQQELADKLFDMDAAGFYETFKKHYSNFFKYGVFRNVYYFGRGFSSMFLFFNESFYQKYNPGLFYARQSSFKGVSSLLIKEHYPNEIEYLKTVSYLESKLSDLTKGSKLVELQF